MQMPSHKAVSVIHKAFSEATVLMVLGHIYVVFQFKEFPNFLFKSDHCIIFHDHIGTSSNIFFQVCIS